jgi:hypothetical protein
VIRQDIYLSNRRQAKTIHVSLHMMMKDGPEPGETPHILDVVGGSTIILHHDQMLTEDVQHMNHIHSLFHPSVYSSKCSIIDFCCHLNAQNGGHLPIFWAIHFVQPKFI